VELTVDEVRVDEAVVVGVVPVAVVSVDRVVAVEPVLLVELVLVVVEIPSRMWSSTCVHELEPELSDIISRMSLVL